MGMKAKERYKNAKGEVIPGVTTIVGELGWNKNTLVAWANKIGLLGYKSQAYVDDKAKIGKLAHALILAELEGKLPDTADYSSNQIKQAENCLASYWEWRTEKTIEPIMIEKPFISETHQFGGTSDFYGKIDNIPTIVDYKTGKGIWPEFIIQVAAYKHLFEENKFQIDAVRLLSIPRADDESFSEKIINGTQLAAGWEIFKHLLVIYNLKGAIKREV